MSIITAEVRLSSLRAGESSQVLGISATCEPAVRCRLRDLGVTAGTEVTCVRRSPFGSPVVYRIGESDLCLRSSLADLVVVA